jgi:hypothetical protein
MPQAGIFGGGLSTMLFLMPRPGLINGALLHLQSAQTAMLNVKTSYILFSSAQQREMHGHNYFKSTQTRLTGLIKNWRTSSSRPALVFSHSFKNDS